MLTKDEILEYFGQLNELLKETGNKGEIGMVGGAIMCLVFNARNATRDVDAVFEPVNVIRRAAKEIANRNHLPDEWLNDAAKGYLVPGFKRDTVIQFSNLLVWAPDARYMLAMKCISARWDTSDRDDVIFLIKHLNLRNPSEVFSIIESYYPKSVVLAKTKFFLEEVMDNL
jgi:hypothetical protein